MTKPSPQQPSGMPCHRYRPFPAVDLPDRQWPSRRIDPPRRATPVTDNRLAAAPAQAPAPQPAQPGPQSGSVKLANMTSLYSDKLTDQHHER